MSDAGPGGRRPGEADHRARRAATLAAVIDLLAPLLSLHAFRDAAKLASLVRHVPSDSPFWPAAAEFARIGKPPSPLTIEALAQIYDMRAAVANVDF